MTSVYVASAEGYTGKSTVALGLLEQLTRSVERVGIFRPIVRGDSVADSPDYVLDLLTSHEGTSTSYDEAAGVTYDDIHADLDTALDRIVDRYQAVAAKCDAVLVVGSDFTDVATPTEFSVNARIAANLGAPVLLVVNGAGRSPDELRTTAEQLTNELRANHATLFSVVANRCRADDLKADAEAVTFDGVPGFAIPEELLLNAPSVGDLMDACEGRLLSGDKELLHREVAGTLVAGMTLPHVLDRLTESALVVTAGDRAEIVLGVLVAHVAPDFPQISGIVLNGGVGLPPHAPRLIEGLNLSTPIMATDLDTQATVTALTSRRGRLSKDAPRKVATALALFAEHVDGKALVDRLEVARSETVTPLMFEHRLIDRAIADRRHIVLPEGEDDRILRASDILLRRGVADLTLLGDPVSINRKAAELGVDVSRARLVDPENDELAEELAQTYYELRRHRGVDLDEARTIVTDVSYFGTLMVQVGEADGMVSGAAHTTAHTIRPALEVVRTVDHVSVVSS